MEDPLYHDETPIEPDQPCQECRTIGTNTICLKQLEDARNPSCLGHALRLPQDDEHHKGWRAAWRHYSNSLEVWSADHSKDDLLQRAREGCHLCDAFWQADWGEFASEGHQKITLRLLKHQEDPKSSPTHKLSFGHVQGGFELAREPVKNDAVVTKSTGSRTSLRRVKELLETCCEHKTCAKRWRWQNRKRRLPTRLVDLNMVARNGTISVIEGESIPVATTYMTLSHCWGSEPRPSDVPWLSHEKLREGLPLDCLPATFRDACLAVLELDCYHIWIDALCILQGDEADWLRESTRMSDVFSMSVLTIAGSDSSSTNAGLFWRRRNLNLSQIRTKFSCSCTEAILAGFNGDMGYWCRPGQTALPLHSRAWVIQEMALSTRVAYFTNTGVYWVCEEIEGSELQRRKRQMDYILAIPGSIKPNVPFDSNSWINLIHEYSESNLSFDKDRLAALSGLARRCYVGSRGRIGRYCAGLWGTHLHEHLAWRRSGSFEKHMTRRASTYPPPSWSWASINAPVMWQSITLSPACFEVVEIDMNPVLDPYGVVNGGRLRLRTPLISFKIHIDLNEEIMASEESDTHVCNEAGDEISPTCDQVEEGTELFVKTLNLLDPQIEDPYQPRDTLLHQTGAALGEPATHQSSGWPPHKDASQNSSGVCSNESRRMQITATSKLYGGSATLMLDEPAKISGSSPFQEQPKVVMPVNSAENSFPYGLLLEPVVAQRGTYRRVGLVRLFMKGNAYEEWVRRVALLIPEDHYLDEGDDGRYLIDLI